MQLSTFKLAWNEHMAGSKRIVQNGIRIESYSNYAREIIIVMGLMFLYEISSIDVRPDKQWQLAQVSWWMQYDFYRCLTH